MSKWNILTKGFFKENPSLILVLGTCPTLAVTTSVNNAIGMGAATTFVLLMSNILISLLKNVYQVSQLGLIEAEIYIIDSGNGTGMTLYQ